MERVGKVDKIGESSRKLEKVEQLGAKLVVIAWLLLSELAIVQLLEHWQVVSTFTIHHCMLMPPGAFKCIGQMTLVLGTRALGIVGCATGSR